MIGEEHLFLCFSYFKTAVKLAITLISESFKVCCADLILSHLCLKLPAFLASHWHPTGSLQIWYRLNREKEPDIFTPTSFNLANGELHRVQIHREGRDMYVQVGDAYISNNKINFIRNWHHSICFVEPTYLYNECLQLCQQYIIKSLVLFHEKCKTKTKPRHCR